MKPRFTENELLDFLEGHDFHDDLGGWITHGIYAGILSITWSEPGCEDVTGEWKLQKLAQVEVSDD